jgi:Zn-dependent peptidase ImmA (M78 family)
MTRQRSDAALFAEAVVSQFGVDCGLRLDVVASEMGAKIVEIDSPTYDGMLVRVADTNRGRIGISKRIPVEGRKRFTAAHELGHYVLGHGSDVLQCRPHDIETWDPKVRQEERDANTFAAEVLMPAAVIRPLIARTPDFHQVEQIAELCRTSLTSSARRFVELSTYQVAMVWSENHHVVWYRESGELRRAIRVRALDEGTLAHTCFREGTGAECDGVRVPARCWMYEEGLRDDATLIEWSRAMPRYGGVLTLLYAPDFLEYRTGYEEEDERELDPTDFTLRRTRWPH